MDVSEFSGLVPEIRSPLPSSPAAQRVAAKLTAQVGELLRGAPWRPLHHTLGISGHETEFAHPDELFLVLSLAVPCLPEAQAQETKEFLKAELQRLPPFAESGYEYRFGRARESYDVPETLLRQGRSQAASLLGIYAFWAYCRHCGDAAVAGQHWKEVKARAQPYLTGPYVFALNKTNSTKGESQRLNGDLAGMLGLARLARAQGDVDLHRQATQRCRELLELRINLERLNPYVIERSDAATKGLHNFRLARYNLLVPELGRALASHCAACAPGNLRILRAERNGWFLAAGDRLIGGENYTNPLHFPRALFAGAAWVEQLPAEDLFGFIDVPWCHADLSFIEKCVSALWSAGGQRWTKLP